ncbi:UDP-N-acetylglucosamine acyltransferase [Tamaricihabitans halophyticus]|nr:UDP-N-acetylglucosamine acyltransferase [Tamaricihabitans halophyticus]
MDSVRSSSVHPSSVHPSAVIGDGVELGSDVTIGPSAVVLGPAWLGDGCWIGPGCVIGTPPEITSTAHNRRWDGALAHQGVRIGPRTVIRELSTVHQGSHRPTTIGADCWLLNRSYVAHDCQLGDGVTLSAGVSIGGNVALDDAVNLGMNAVVHQRRVLGAGALVGMGAVVDRDIPPFGKAYGCPAKLHGVHELGVAKAGLERAVLRTLTEAYAAGKRPSGRLPEQLAQVFERWRGAGPLRPLVPC